MLTFIALLLGCSQTPADIAFNHYETPITDREPQELGARVVDAGDITIHEHPVTITLLSPGVAQMVSDSALCCVGSGQARFRLEGGGLVREHTVTCALD